MKIKQPILLVDKQKAIRNIKRIREKALATGTTVIPHFKTHQSLEIGKWFTEEGIEAITVSSVSMAKYFAEAGWKQIYIAFPLNILELEDIAELASSHELTILVNDQVQLEALFKSGCNKVSVKIEIECGGKRSGILSTETSLIESLIKSIIGSKHVFDGFYSHFGHTYAAKNTKEVSAIFKESFHQLITLKKHFTKYDPRIAIGDTPSATVLPSFEHIDSIHAGNYVFYDLTQSQIGHCREDDIAIALAAPIVSKNAPSMELIVYGGGIHLSKDVMLSQEFGTKSYGKVVRLTDKGWGDTLDGCFLSSISQEHGVLQVTEAVFEELSIGEVIGVLPVHSCMTADVMRGYIDTEGHRIDHLKGLSYRFDH